MLLQRVTVVTFGVAFGAVIWACSSDSDLASPASPAPSGADGGDAATAQSDSAAPVDGAPSCMTVEVTTMFAPVNLVFLLERAGSMNNDDRLVKVTGTLATVFADADMALTDVNVAISSFARGAEATSCMAATYAEPEVVRTALPTTTFNAFLNVLTPNGNAPTQPALTGTLQAANAIAHAHPTEATAVVLMTDGPPSGCTLATNSDTGVASAALAGLPIRTYVVALDGPSTSLDAVAKAGGTSAARVATNKAEIAQNIKAIRDDLQCSLPLPQPALHPEIVAFTLPNATDAVPRSPDCSTADKTGWHFDSDTTPSRVVLCEATCEAMRKASAPAKVTYRCE